MNTKLKILVTEHEAVVGRGLNRVLSDKGHKLNTHLKAANDGKMHTPLKTTGMLIAAPLIALAYVIALPFVGLYHIAKLAYEARALRLSNC